MRQLVLRTGTKIPELGLGTYMIGGGIQRDTHNDDEGQIKGLRYALNQGFSWIRTAQNYAEGYCETLVGKAIKEFPREKLFMMAAVNEHFGVDEKTILKEAQASLKRLGIHRFDLYMMGGLNELISLKIIARALMKLKREGITREIGVGNYRLEELKVMDELTNGELAYDEVHFNLIVREPLLNGVYEYCLKHKILMGAYRPLQLGQLSNSGIQILDEMSKKYRKSQAQIALQWVKQFKGVAPVVKAIQPIHINELLSQDNWRLSKSDFDRLTDEFPVQMRLSDCTPPRTFFTQ